MNGYKVLVNKSTVPVGTAERVPGVVRRETTHPVQRSQQSPSS
jgi:UDP-glucose 6-dehydrogenase